MSALIAALHVDNPSGMNAWLAAIACSAFALLAWQRPQTWRLDGHRPLILTLVILFAIPAIDKDVRNLVNGKVRVWNVYHYYLGAKYYDELGKTDLYVATLAADREGANRWTRHIRTVRNQETYALEPVDRALAHYRPAAHFSPERWQSFRKDVSALAKHRRAANWKDIFRDRGYNGTPVWTTIGGALAHAIPASSPLLPVLCSLDLVLLAAAFTLLGCAFGWTTNLIVLLLFAASPTNIERLAGGFLQLDWLCSLIAGIALLKLRRPALAGAVFSYALMTRVFPLFMLCAFFLPCLPAVLRAVPTIKKHGLRDAWSSLHPLLKPYARFLAGLATGCTLLLGSSLLAQEGTNRWQAFITNINTHADQHVLGERRVGLEHAFTIDLSSPFERQNASERAAALDSQRIGYGLIATLLLAGFMLAATKVPAEDALILGMVAVFAMLVLSRYYWAILCFLPLLQSISTTGRCWLVAGQLMVFTLFHAARLLGADWHQLYVLLNWSLLTCFSLLLFALFVRQERGGRLTG